MYGAERWILALNNNLDPELVRSEIAVIQENSMQQDVIDQFRKSGQIVNVLLMRSRFSFSAIQDLCRLIRKRNIHIIHTHGYKSDFLGLIAAKITGIKAISTPHGFGEPRDLKLKLYILLGKICLWFFDSVSPLSQQLVDELIKARVPKEKIVFIRNAVDLKEVEEYRISKTEAREHEKQRIGYIGQLIPRKKINHMLDIFNQLWLKIKNVELVILGDGESREEMEKYARTLPSSDAVKFLGYRGDRLKILRAFDLFVMTSSDEGIPRCLMEAIAMGVPIAAYDIPGIDQLVIHQKTGLLADFGDKNKLALYWEKLLDDRDLALSLAEGGRQHVIEKYSGKRMANEYTGLYRSLILSHSVK